MKHLTEEEKKTLVSKIRGLKNAAKERGRQMTKAVLRYTNKSKREPMDKDGLPPQF
jgi:ribosomal protein L18E